MDFVAYIDEAGDEGFGRLGTGEKTAQSQWFAIGAILVEKADDRQVPAWRDETLAFFPRKKSKHLHFRDLNHEQRVQSCRYLAGKPLECCFVAYNKATLVGDPDRELFKQKQYLYNHLTCFLLEMLTRACQQRAERIGDGDARLRIVFSRRAGTDYNVMKTYLEWLKAVGEHQSPGRSIDWSVLGPGFIQVEDHSKRAGLQIADVFTSAFWHALEPGNFGFTEPRYGRELASRLIRNQSTRLNSGFTILPTANENPLTEEQAEFVYSVK